MKHIYCRVHTYTQTRAATHNCTRNLAARKVRRVIINVEANARAWGFSFWLFKSGVYTCQMMVVIFLLDSGGENLLKRLIITDTLICDKNVQEKGVGHDCMTG